MRIERNSNHLQTFVEPSCKRVVSHTTYALRARTASVGYSKGDDNHSTNEW